MGLANTTDPVIDDENMSHIRSFFRYANFFCFGVITLVLPLEIINIFKVAWMLLSAFCLCCDNKILDKVEKCFERIVCWLTGLKNDYQLRSLKFADGIVKITFEDFFWLIIQFSILSGSLDVPEIMEDESTLAALIVSTLLSISSLIGNLV